MCFQGEGYSPKFIKNYFEFIKNLAKNPMVQITFQADEICMPCPNRVKKGCIKQAAIDRLDRAHATLLELKDGQALLWDRCVARAKSKITLEKFHQICESCGWKKLGICETIVQSF